MTTALVWLRQDLRLKDNPALSQACASYDKVIPLYILDKKNSPLGGAQSWWLHHSLLRLQKSLKKIGGDLLLKQGNPHTIITQLIEEYAIDAVYWNRCYEPLTIQRDKKMKEILLQKRIPVISCNGSLLNEPWQVANKSGTYFKVFTPFWKHCLQVTPIPAPLPTPTLLKIPSFIGENIDDWKLLPEKPNWAAGFSEYWEPGETGAQKRLGSFIDNHLKGYTINRDIPAKDSTSKLSPHIHFGEISPWDIWRAIDLARLDINCDLQSADRFLSELGWREFSYYLLYHFPSLPLKNFKAEFDTFPWHNDASFLKKWQKGMTGYPLIDAGMRELWQTGYMHNRVRMIVASFLTKDLLIDWRIGADWFLDTLVDADLANNSASWQWVSGSGADAAPYFRIFNPTLQSKKFDPLGKYIKQWVPELAGADAQSIHEPWAKGLSYPKPLVLHDEARIRALTCYQSL